MHLLRKNNCASYLILGLTFKILHMNIGTIVVIVILGCLSLVGLFIYRDHRSRSDVDIDPDRLDLVGNMQQQSPTRPYSLTRPPGEYLQVNT